MKKSKQKNKKIKWIVIGCVAGGLLLICVAGSLFGGNGMMPVTTTQAVYGDVEDVLDISGTVESEETVTYYAPAAGVIGEVAVQPGDAVKKGELMISYDGEELSNRLTQEKLQAQISESGYKASRNSDKEAVTKYNEAVTSLAALEQQITDAKNNLSTLNRQMTEKQNKYSNDVATTTYDLSRQQSKLEGELKELADSEGPDSDAYKAKEQELQKLLQTVEAYNYSKQLTVTDEETRTLQKKIEDATENLEKLQTEKAKVESQKSASEAAMIDSEIKKQNKANYDLSVMGLEEAESQIEAAQAGITAEFDGVVSEVTAIEGAPVTEGMQMVTVSSSRDVKITVSLTRFALEKVKTGQKAEITILNHTYQGTVSKISRMAVTGPNGTASVAAEIHIENPDENIVLGVEAKAKILTDSAKGVLLIPIAAVNADQEGDFVYVVENGKVQKKYITVGISSNEFVQVKEGITEEDSIVTNVYANIEEGMSVMAVPEK